MSTGRKPRSGTSHDDVKHILIGDPEASAEYERLAPRFEFAQRVIEARRNRGWTQAELARAVGVQRPAISRLEAGDHDPRLGTVVAVCRALDLPLVIGQDGHRLAG